jgi:hypothetical protein
VQQSREKDETKEVGGREQITKFGGAETKEWDEFVETIVYLNKQVQRIESTQRQPIKERNVSRR